MRVCERPREFEATFDSDGKVTVTDAFGRTERLDIATFESRYVPAPDHTTAKPSRRSRAK